MYDRWRQSHLAVPVQALLLASLSTISFAQHETGETAASGEKGSEPLIEEIIVTATRREADVQSVPLSVSVLTSELLEQLGATGFTDYARTVPGLSFTDPGWGGEQHAIRGIKLSVTLPEVNPLTTLYLDDVPIMGSGTLGHWPADPLLVDIERIEVLRGPQGTLFGASAMAGAIRIITRKPDLDRQDAFVDAGISTMKGGGTGYDLHAMLNAPFAEDKAAIRAVGYLHNRAGYVDNIATGDENVNNIAVVGGRLSAANRFGDRVRVTGRVAYQDRESDGTSWEDVGLPPRQQNHVPESVGDEWVNYNLVVDADLGWADLVSSTSYLDRTLEGTVDISLFGEVAFGINTPIYTNIIDDSDDFLQELRLASKNDRKLLWVLGVFYQDQNQDLFQDMPAPGFDEQTGGLASAFGLSDNLILARYNYTLSQLALYGDMTYALTDKLELGVGARWFDIDRDFMSDVQGLMGGDPFESGEAHETGVTPRFSASYQANDNVSVYASAAEGFRSGGVNNGEGAGLPGCEAEIAALGYDGYPMSYNSDSLWSYDLGAKTRWRSGRLQLDVVVYHIDWSDMQTTQFLDCGTYFVQNAGKARSDGIELEVFSRPTERLSVSLAGQYNDAELREDVPSLGGRAGDPLPGTPRFSGSIVASYDFPAFGRDAFIHGSYQYAGKSYDVFDPAVRHELPAYDLVNLSIGFRNGPWSLTLFVDNVFDERGIVGIEDDIIRYSVNATPPRTIGFFTHRSF